VVFGPNQLRVMYRAYDEAFHALEPDLSPDPVAVHCVKMKLAGDYRSGEAAADP
jgi:hypothetical protein